MCCIGREHHWVAIQYENKSPFNEWQIFSFPRVDDAQIADELKKKPTAKDMGKRWAPYMVTQPALRYFFFFFGVFFAWISLPLYLPTLVFFCCSFVGIIRPVDPTRLFHQVTTREVETYSKRRGRAERLSNSDLLWTGGHTCPALPPRKLVHRRPVWYLEYN